MISMQMFVILFMAPVIITQGVLTTAVNSSKTTIPTTLSYVCKASGDINITKPQGFELIAFNSSTACKKKSQVSTGHLVLQNCTNKIQTVALTHNSFIGGQLPIFRLLCNDTKYTVVLNSSELSFTNPTPITLTHTIPHPQVSLEIRNGQNKVSSAVIGTPLALVIKAPVGFTIAPNVCKALSGTTSQNIWKAVNSTKCSYENGVISSTWVKNTHKSPEEYSITIYAFRFKDSNTIKISCTVDVCANGVTGCQEVCVSASTKRRRRNTSNHSGKKLNKSLEAQLRIYDTVNDEQSLSGAGRLKSSYVSIGFAVLLLKKLLW